MIIVIGFELAKTSLDKILNPTAVAVSLPLLLVLVGSIAVKLWMSLFNRKLGKMIDSTALLAVSADSRNDVIATAAVLLAAIVEQLTKLPVDGYMGMAGQRFASIHVEMDQKEDPLVCHEIIDDMERLCFEKYQVHLVIHYDPVVTDDPEIQAVRQQVADILQTIDHRLTMHDFRMVRGIGHSNLIFDIAMPHDMAERKSGIKKMLDEALQGKTEGVYHTVITFDLVD